MMAADDCGENVIWIKKGIPSELLKNSSNLNELCVNNQWNPPLHLISNRSVFKHLRSNQLKTPCCIFKEDEADAVVSGEEALRKYRNNTTYCRNRLNRTDRREVLDQLLYLQRKKNELDESDGLRVLLQSTEKRYPDSGDTTFSTEDVNSESKSYGLTRKSASIHSETNRMEKIKLATQMESSPLVVMGLSVGAPRPKHLPRKVRKPSPGPGPSAPPLIVHTKPLVGKKGSEPDEGRRRRPRPAPDTTILRRRRCRYWVSPREVRHCVTPELDEAQNEPPDTQFKTDQLPPASRGGSTSFKSSSSRKTKAVQEKNEHSWLSSALVVAKPTYIEPDSLKISLCRRTQYIPELKFRNNLHKNMSKAPQPRSTVKAVSMRTVQLPNIVQPS